METQFLSDLADNIFIDEQCLCHMCAISMTMHGYKYLSFSCFETDS